MNMISDLRSLFRILLCCLLFPFVGMANPDPSGALFFTDFQDDEVGKAPSQGWSSISLPVSGSTIIALDEENLFGFGTDKKYLQVRDGKNFEFSATLSDPQEIIVLRLQIIARNSAEDSRWINFNILAGEGTEYADRAHVFSMNLISRVIRNTGVSYGKNGELLDISVVLNNSTESIRYSGPEGEGEYPLAAGRASVWINGKQEIASYLFVRGDRGAGPVRKVTIQADSTSVVSFDLGLIMVRDGAEILGDFPTPPPVVIPTVLVGSDGRLEYTEDAKGNRVPDFSNAGYMGGGFPIPDVPVKRIVERQPGDDRARIQAAIDEVAAMPIDTNGFRGAVLLRAGEYEVGNSLKISASGIVLRGEGDGPNGTILHATGRFQYALIEVGGSGSWSEVSGTRRPITDSYVPVGARSFRVSDASVYNVGDSIIVHRPSTAEWISAIGMDQIPNRSDGLPVSQWTPGSRDLRFDRTITAIDGDRITIDAPLVNALESEYGGGSVYKYTFPGRIAQVGIENLRGVSAYEGGPWTTNQFDENHAWNFIVMDRLQNAWVRDTTALHFGFGNTLINSRAKWVTVQDSRNLYPVSTISGSRRYPFYIQGQLSLVQRCYANYARHDYGTSSLTFGPNGFLNSSGEHSYSDTGPHHRWAVGTLYDNIHVPDRAIAIQTRLNYGSGHGWAGANHVVWNSSANRIVVQNPPTAQNWAFGVIGTKWAGAFPNHAEDGYWISHGVPVEPQSLYLKQLEDRLAPEGSGGGISIVRFRENRPQTLQPGRLIRFPISRIGNDDGRIEVKVVVEGRSADRVELPDFVEINARNEIGYVYVSLQPDVVFAEAEELTLKLVHGPGYSIGEIGSVPLLMAPSPFYAWRGDHFSGDELEDPAISGPTANPAGDGVENLLKYALNLSPFENATAEDQPKVEVKEGRLMLTFNRGDDRTDIEYRVEVSENLVDWISGEDATEEWEVTGDGNWKQVTVADRKFSDGSGRGFIRLRVSPVE